MTGIPYSDYELNHSPGGDIIRAIPAATKMMAAAAAAHEFFLSRENISAAAVTLFHFHSMQLRRISTAIQSGRRIRAMP